MAGIAYLDGHRLSRGLRAGIGRVIADRERLNRINVFPVPDGDTGTNLVLTMNSVLAALGAHRERHAGRTLERIADAALDGARGNSGAIMAQFFQGLGDACGELRLLTTDNFVDAVAIGSRYAREAMNEPREGTIVTVLREYSRELEAIRDAGHDFAALLEKGLKRASEALAQTTQQLDVLRKAGVVDAGAQGFVDLLQGVTQFVREGSVGVIEETPPSDETAAPFAAVELSQAIEHRYCTECIVTGDDVDRRKLREALTTMGSSLVIAGTRRKVRVHIHVDRPEALFETASRFGAVSSEKADDMKRQRDAAHALNDTVAVVMDSAGDIPDEDFERLGIHMVPVRVHFGDKSYLDKISLSAEQFYEQLETNPHHPKTSQPAPGDFRRLYEFLCSHHRGVVSIHVTGMASGTFQAAESAAARTHGRAPVIAVDSRNASVGQGLIAIYAAELARAGCDLDQLIVRLDEIITRTRTFGLVGDLEYAVRGGRVPRSRKVVADLLRLNPVLASLPDGRIGTGGMLLGRRNGVEKFGRFVSRQADPGQEYILAVGHACNPDGADQLLDMLLTAIPSTRRHHVTELGTALGAHAGPGSLVVSLQEFRPATSLVQREGTPRNQPQLAGSD